jgi:protein O-mannosyl-transferase
MSERRTRVLLVAAAALLAAALYASTLTHPLVYGDSATILGNASIRDATNWRWVLGAGRSRPLTAYSVALMWALSGAQPWAHHLLNVLLHIANVLVLFALSGRLLDDAGVRERARRTTAQALAAALFAAHPMMTESAGYANARAGLLCALFAQAALLAFRAWSRSDKRSASTATTAPASRLALAGVYAAFVGAAASKESAVALPVALWLYDRAFGDASGRRRRAWAVHVPLIAVTALAGAWRIARLVGIQTRELPTLGHAATQLVAFWRYVRLMVAPVGQTIFHEVAPVESARDVRPWLALVALVAAAIAIVRVARRPGLPRLAAFGAAWFALWLVPSSAFPLAEVMAEHRAYEASLGCFVALAAGVAALRPSRALAAAGAALVLAGALASWARLRVWRDPVTLWADATQKAPGAWQPRYALGDALRARGDCAAAVPEYQRAAALNAREERVFTNLGICLATLGRDDDAFSAFDAAMRVQPTDARAWYNLGVLARDRGRLDNARWYFTRAATLGHPTARAEADKLDPEKKR